MTYDEKKVHISEPSDFLVSNIDILPGGFALDIAMGEGRNSIFLAQRGYLVEGVDNSIQSIERALASAEKAGVKISTRVADLEKEYVIKTNQYDLIICFNYLQRSLIPQIKAGLKPGGMIVYETYTIDQTQFGHPRNPNFLLKHNELLEMFRDFRCLRYHEGIYNNSKASAGIITEKI